MDYLKSCENNNSSDYVNKDELLDNYYNIKMYERRKIIDTHFENPYGRKPADINTYPSFEEWKKNEMHGQGTYTWKGGDKYVGEFKDSKSHGQETYTWIIGSKYVVGNGKMVNNTSKGLTRTEMEQNTWENLKIVNITDKEL